MKNRFGKYVREARERLGATLRDFAEMSGISYSHLSKIERGESKPSEETVEKIAAGLNVNSYELKALAGYFSKEVVEDLLIGGHSVDVVGKFKMSLPFKKVFLHDLVHEWTTEMYKDDLSEIEIEELAEDIDEYFHFRRRFIKSRRKKRGGDKLK